MMSINSSLPKTGIHPAWLALAVSSLLATPAYSAQSSPCYKKGKSSVSYHRVLFDPQFKRAKIIDHPLPGADPASFTELNGPPFSCSGKDRSHVYWHDKVIQKANPAFFHHIGEGYAKDNRHIFYNGNLMSEADFNSFQLFTFEKNGPEPCVDSKDWKSIYFRGKQVATEGFRVDAPTFRPLSRYFYRDINAVYRLGKKGSRPTLTILPEANQKSIRLLDKAYPLAARDRQRVFLFAVRGRKFTVITPKDIESFRIVNLNYSADSENVYFRGKLFPQADRESFVAVGPRQAKDRYRRFDARGKVKK